jgi:branched-subunit amino acid ABC-type transport system permease component
MEFFTVSLINGTIYGLLLFMVSAGLTLIFGMMGVLNFAHTSFYMVGAYLAYTLQKFIGFWPAVIIAPLIVGLLGVVVERWFLRRVHRYGHAHELLLTFGLSFIIAEIIKLFFGNYPVNYQVPASLSFAAFRLFGTDYPFYRLMMGLVSLLMFGLIYLLLSRTRIGIVQERQNRQILESMNARAAQQLKLQQAVEGLSVAAISYYVIGLLGYAGKAAKAAGLPINPDLATGLVVPVVAACVWLGLRRMHKGLGSH